MNRWRVMRRFLLASALAGGLAGGALAYASIWMGQECPANYWDVFGQIICALWDGPGGGSSGAA